MHSCFLALLSLVSLVTAFDKQPYHKNTCGFTVMGVCRKQLLVLLYNIFFTLATEKRRRTATSEKLPEVRGPGHGFVGPG